MPVDYLGLAALRRDQCVMMAESQNSGTEKRQQLLCNRTVNMFLCVCVHVCRNVHMKFCLKYGQTGSVTCHEQPSVKML
jgi:hypothetical protein